MRVVAIELMSISELQVYSIEQARGVFFAMGLATKTRNCLETCESLQIFSPLAQPANLHALLDF